MSAPGQLLATAPGDVRWIVYLEDGIEYAAPYLRGRLVRHDAGGWWSANGNGSREALGDQDLDLLAGTAPDGMPIWPEVASLRPEPSEESPRVLGEAVAVLEFVSAAQLVQRVAERGPVGYLVRPIWPADAYGVIAAQHKAGKTWAGLDLLVSVASGTNWLGLFAVDRPGPVLAFLGEGGERKMLRRLQAICAGRDLDVADLPIELCFRAPHLTSGAAVLQLAAKLGEQRWSLVVIDPLYLAARGAKSASLFEMGTHLETVQMVCQHAGAALVIVHHWNQTGSGKGSERMSGAGPAEWGRVLISAEVEATHTDPETKCSAVTLALAIEGDEVPESEVRIRRHVCAEDPDDLDSPLSYAVEPLGPRSVEDGPDGLRPAERRVLAVLKRSPTALTVHEIGDALAVDDTGKKPLRARTIQAALKVLDEQGLAESEEAMGGAYIWRALTASAGVEDAF